MALADFQDRLVRDLAHTLDRSACAVAVGRRGFGKRTVAQATANRLGLAFLAVAVDAPARAVCRTLLGHEDLASPECTERGLLAQEDACVYLSGGEGVNPDLLPVLREVFRARGMCGLASEPHSPVVILGVCADSVEPTLRETDPFVLATPGIRLPAVYTPEEVLQVAQSMVSSMHATSSLTRDDFENVRLPEEGLAALRRWVISAAVSGIVNGDGLTAAMADDMAQFVEQIRYRGRVLTIRDYVEWVNQFDLAIRPLVDHLVRSMVERRYVMSEREFHDTIDRIVAESGVERGSRVVLCEWQPFGKSGPMMTHRVKERGDWGRRAVTLNLADDPDVWRARIGGRELPAVLADDFVGTGDSLAAIEPRLRLLLDTCPGLRVRVLLVAGFVDGVRRMRHLEREYGDRFKVVVGRLLQNSDTCFHETSSLLGPAERLAMGAFCDGFGGLVETRIPRGYGRLGALFAFPESVPNTTLPPLWFDSRLSEWRPLLPASMGSADER